MKSRIIGACRMLGAAVLSLVVLAPAAAAVRVLSAQYLAQPDPSYTFFGQTVAIEGRFIIAVADRPGGRVALLYRRDDAGKWVYLRKLLDVPGPPTVLRSNVVLKNGTAVIQFSDAVAIFEQLGDTYVRAQTPGVIRHPGGIAVSAGRILIGGDNCTYDAVIYQRNAEGVWGLIGRIDDGEGACSNDGVDVELNNDYAMIRVPGNERLVRVWRRNGSALAWNSAGSFTIPVAAGLSSGPMALQKTTAVSPGSAVFWNVNGAWNYQGQLSPIDHANGSGHAYQVVYRDGVLLTSEAWSAQYADAQPYAYLETAPGRFTHVANLVIHGWVQDLDVSGRTVVAGAEGLAGERNVGVFVLPEPLAPAPAIARDFNDFVTSDLQTLSGQFDLAASGGNNNYVYRQSTTSGLAISLAQPTDWPGYQRVEANIAPTFSAGDGWVGLVLRYTDANNYYYATIRNDNSSAIYRRRNGVDTLLQGGSSAGPNPSRVAFSINGDRLQLQINNQFLSSITDRALRTGQAGIATFHARADFDNLYATPTAPLELMWKDYAWFDWGRPLMEIGGDWHITGEVDPEGLSQVDPNATALAISSAPTDDQQITSVMRLDAFNASAPGASFGLVARWVDERNYFYLSVRSDNTLKINHMDDGVTRQLASAPFTALPGQWREFRFSVVRNELHVFVDGALVATAHSNALPRGKFGLAADRATATWQTITVLQP